MLSPTPLDQPLSPKTGTVCESGMNALPYTPLGVSTYKYNQLGESESIHA